MNLKDIEASMVIFAIACAFGFSSIHSNTHCSTHEQSATDMICNAVLYISDDFGDNKATMSCQLESGHAGLHLEDFGRGVVTWKEDESECEDEDYFEIEGDEELEEE